MKGLLLPKGHMHGAAHDFVVLLTIKDGQNCFSGEAWGAGQISEFEVYKEFKKAGFSFPVTQRDYKKILDIGSLDINGNMRTYDFLGHPPTWLQRVSSTQNYVGVDLLPGNNVDEVMDSHSLRFENESFDLVMCLNMMEHDSDPLSTLKEAWRVLEKGGTFLLTCSNDKHEPHGELGGGSEHYEGLTTKKLIQFLDQAGMSGCYEHTSIGGDHFVQAQKPVTVISRKGKKYENL